MSNLTKINALRTALRQTIGAAAVASTAFVAFSLPSGALAQDGSAGALLGHPPIKPAAQVFDRVFFENSRCWRKPAKPTCNSSRDELDVGFLPFRFKVYVL